jgi:adenosylmethionine-8-amino-7-oxononanoate aminotransferase
MQALRRWRPLSSSLVRSDAVRPWQPAKQLLTRTLQYFWETKQPQRKNFIGRKLSYHGNTLATLSVAYHPGRRAPYAAIMNDTNFHHVSPAYAKRFQHVDETEEQYVQRLKQELEDMFESLGGDTVIACASNRALTLLLTDHAPG